MEVACDHAQTFSFEPQRTALLCIDYERDFLANDGMCAARGLPVATLQTVIEPARQVLHAARSWGMTVIHMREAYAPDLSDLNDFRKARDTIVGAPGPLGRFLIRGEPGTQIIEELAPLPDESAFDKAGFSGFYRTPLQDILQHRAITHLILMGITTQCCVASTLRSAVDHGYFPLLLADCCAAYDRQLHDATIETVFSENHQFGWVSDSRRMIAAGGK